MLCFPQIGILVDVVAVGDVERNVGGSVDLGYILGWQGLVLDWVSFVEMRGLEKGLAMWLGTVFYLLSDFMYPLCNYIINSNKNKTVIKIIICLM